MTRVLAKRVITVFVVLMAGCTSTVESGAGETTRVRSEDFASSESTATPPATAQTTELAVLFVGNSHTSTHDVPALVEQLLDSDPTINADVSRLGAEFLRLAAADDRIVSTVGSGGWDVVVLQGQEISQSHTVDYSRTEAIGLAQEAVSAGARAMFFAEWSRRDVDETEYFETIYREMAEVAGADVIPVGRAWDRFLTAHPGYPLWATDGNHSSSEGAFLAAATIAYAIAGPDAAFIAGADLEPLLDAARLTIEARSEE